MKNKKYYLLSGDYFSRYADTYDRQGRQKSACVNWITERIVERVDKEGAVIDIGTGTGWLLSKITKKYPDSFVVGIDVSRKMIKIARKKLNGGKMHFVVSPAEHMPFKNGTFDFVVSLLVWEHVSEQDKVIRKIFSMLKPGGKFILGTNFKSDSPYDGKIREFRKENKKLSGKMLKDWKQLICNIKKVSGSEYYRKHPRHHEQYYYDILDQMKKAGFNDVEMLPTFLCIFGVFIGTKAFK